MSTEHGGNIYRASLETGIPERKIRDFSASINPLGVPESVVSAIKKEIRGLPNYPETNAEPLALHLSESLGVNRESIICGNGSTELIYLTARTLSPGRVLIPAPTFSEYERACRIGNAGIRRLPLKKENNFDIVADRFIRAMKGCDMAFLCNPNNPTGRLVGRTEVLKIAAAAERLKCYLIVDEAFIDFCPGESVVDSVASGSRLIVLRSLTKFYALSGLRIGYGVFPMALACLIRGQKEPWTVNSLAQRAGIAALHDKDYKKEALRAMSREKRFFEKSLRDMGMKFTPSSANYYLLEIANAKEAAAVLRRKGLLVRDCSNFAGLDGGFIRVAVKSREDNTALLKELSSL